MNESSNHLEDHLTAFEGAVAAQDIDAARLALRCYLFGTAGAPVEGSTADAVVTASQAPGGRDLAAAVVLRALDAGVIAEGRQDVLARSVVLLCEGALPKLCDFVGVQQKSQNYEKLERLRGAHGSIMKILDPSEPPMPLWTR